MTYMLCRNRGADFAKWSRGFDSHTTGHRESGLKLVHLWRDVDDPTHEGRHQQRGRQGRPQPRGEAHSHDRGPRPVGRRHFGRRRRIMARSTRRPAGPVMLIKTIIIVMLVLIFISLFSALLFLYKDKGRGTRTAKSLTIRISLSLALFLLLMAGFYFGIIPPGRLSGATPP